MSKFGGSIYKLEFDFFSVLAAKVHQQRLRREGEEGKEGREGREGEEGRGRGKGSQGGRVEEEKRKRKMKVEGRRMKERGNGAKKKRRISAAEYTNLGCIAQCNVVQPAHLPQGDNSPLWPHHTSLQHQIVILHLTKMGEPTLPNRNGTFT